MNRKEKNQLKKIADKADDFYTAFNNSGFAEEHGGIDKLMQQMFSALDEWQGVEVSVVRRKSIEVVARE